MPDCKIGFMSGENLKNMEIMIMSVNSFNTAKKAALKKYFSRMNEMQQEAVFTVNGPVLVLAGAGSGKTTVIVNRIANMINFGNAYLDETGTGSDEDIAFLNDYAEGKTDDFETLRDTVAVSPIKPWNILAITFTNKAAGELKSRLADTLGIHFPFSLRPHPQMGNHRSRLRKRLHHLRFR